MRTTPNGPGKHGKSVKDDAMLSNGPCRDLVAAKGGINKHPKIQRGGEKVLPGHRWHRKTWRDYWNV